PSPVPSLPPSPGEGEKEGAAPALLGASLPPESRALAAATSDGRMILKSMGFTVTFEGQQRVVTPDDTPPVTLELDPQHGPLGAFAAQLGDDGNAVGAA